MVPMSHRFLILFIGLLGVWSVVGGVLPADAQQEACCVRGPGDCYQKLDYEDIAACAGGYSLQLQACSTIKTCQAASTTQVLCCVCRAGVGDYSNGTCFGPQTQTQPCGPSTAPCEQSTEACTEIDLCKEWAAKTETLDIPEDNPRLVWFTPQVTIPGSQLFNQGTPISITGATLGEYIVAVYFFLVSSAGILATVFIMYGGVRYIISFGNQSKIAAAQETITSALMGLLIAVASYMILLTINPNLVKFDGINAERQFPVVQQERAQITEKAAGYSVTANVSRFDGCLTEAATLNGVNRDWLKALMLVESAGNPSAKSPAGAYGLLQLLPTTAQQYSPSVTAQQLLNPAINIRIAAQYYKDLLYHTCPTKAKYKSGKSVPCYPDQTQCKRGDVKYANAAYNGGVGANCSSVTCPGQTWWECVENAGYAETRNYVVKVQAAYDKIQQSKQNPGQFPLYVWQDAGAPTCNELQAQPTSMVPMLSFPLVYTM